MVYIISKKQKKFIDIDLTMEIFYLQQILQYLTNLQFVFILVSNLKFCYESYLKFPLNLQRRCCPTNLEELSSITSR